MIIDSHTHIFPDKIAKRTIELLKKKGNLPAYSDGTVNGLLSQMQRADVDLAINLPVLTNPNQFDTVINYAIGINDAFKNQKTRIISFAGIHPDCEDIDGKMEFIKRSGFLGVKIHPDYQDRCITYDGYIRILECAKEYDLIVVTHAGVDAAYRDREPYCSVSGALELIKRVRHCKLVLAHMGGYDSYQRVCESLCGEDVYLDTAYVLKDMSESHFRELLKRHGEDKVLFASDSPWSSIESDVQKIRSFSLGEETENKIFYKNAAALFGICR